MLELGYCDKLFTKDQINHCDVCMLYNRCKLSIFCNKCGAIKEKDISYFITLKCGRCHEHIYDRECKEVLDID